MSSADNISVSGPRLWSQKNGHQVRKNLKSTNIRQVTTTGQLLLGLVLFFSAKINLGNVTTPTHPPQGEFAYLPFRGVGWTFMLCILFVCLFLVCLSVCLLVCLFFLTMYPCFAGFQEV